MSLQKDAYYFPHFSNARNDRKLRRIRKELGAEGYGIYFMLLEVLREQSNFAYPLDDIDLLADDLGTSEQKVRTIVANYGLFEVNEREHFFSANLLKYLEPYFQRKNHARIAAKKRWDNELTDDAGVMPEHSPSNAGTMQSKVKKSKVNKSKGKQMETHEKTGRPISSTRYTTLVTEYGQETVDEYIQKIADWCDAKGKEYKDFAAAAANWIKKDIADGKSLRKSQGRDNINLIANKLQEDV